MPSVAAKRILITRSRHQASALATQLQALGAEPILIPTVAIAPPETYTALDAALTHLGTFHWLLFTSANAVQAFAQRTGLTILSAAQQNPVPHTPAHPAKAGSPPAPVGCKGWGIARSAAVLAETLSNSSPRIAAIGPATAHALTEIGLSPDLIPPQAVAESLAQSLLTHITPHRTRILLVRAEAARDTLPDILRAAGAGVTIAPAYRNIIPQDSIPLLQSLFSAPSAWPGAITFTSSSTAANLLTLLEAAHLTLPADGAHGRTILRASIGPITSRTLRDLGYPPHLEAPEANIPSLVQILAEKLRLRL